MDVRTLIQIYQISKEYFNFTPIIIVLAIFGTTFVLKNRKKVLGFAITTGNYLHYMAVRNEYRGKGYGTKIFQVIKPKIKKLRVDKNNYNAINFYEKSGFKKIRESNWITGKKYLMEKQEKLVNQNE